MSGDAFVHLPGLRERVTPPERSALRFSAESLAALDERARQQGRPAHWRLPDHEVDASRRAALATLPADADLWVFAYGSLMWDPGFHFAEVRRARLEGFERRFCLRTTLGRGSPERPGLMLSLLPSAGACEGLAFRIEAARVAPEAAIVWRREMLRGSYRPAMLPADTPQGPVTALVFAANLDHPDHLGDLGIEESALMVARGQGLFGSNLQYLEQLAQQLAHLGIVDGYIARLLADARARAGG
jgi:glutathione-specific gamma-glutamylcyclotransferase